MDYYRCYLFFYVVTIIVTNLYAFLKKERELPIIISLYGVFVSLFHIKTFLKGLFFIVFLPFINIFITYVNTRANKPFLMVSSDDMFTGYDIKFSDKTIETFESLLKKNNIPYKKKYLQNSLKEASIMAFRNTFRYFYLQKAESFKINSLEMNYLFNEVIEAKIKSPELFKLIENDIINYIKENKETLTNIEHYVNEENCIVFNTKHEAYEPKVYERKTLNL